MKITDLKAAVIGSNPVVRIVTDEGIDGWGQAESFKPYLKSHILFYKDLILGMDPTDVERVMLRIRRMGSFKPWGSSVSAIEMALWDICGKAVDKPVYRARNGKRYITRPSRGARHGPARRHGLGAVPRPRHRAVRTDSRPAAACPPPVERRS